MDVDIDFPTNFDPLDHFDTAIRASMVKDNKITKHPAGAYFQKMCQDKMTNLAAIPYKEAEALGFFKIDFLHLSLLDNFDSKAEIRALIKLEPDWMLLESPDIVQRLFQIHRHFDTLIKIRPKSVQELADVMSLIRPAKRYLLESYIKDRDAVRNELYRKPDGGGYYFKKSHAIAYSLNIVLQLHLIKGNII